MLLEEAERAYEGVPSRCEVVRRPVVVEEGVLSARVHVVLEVLVVAFSGGRERRDGAVDTWIVLAVEAEDWCLDRGQQLVRRSAAVEDDGCLELGICGGEPSRQATPQTKPHRT